MRIIGGRMRGTALTPVGAGDPAAHLRPTSDRVRESVFNLLLGGRHGDPVTGARVLDLFAGTGALGLEALSRGAEAATFVDQGDKALSILRRNIEKTRAAEDSSILRRDATRLGPCDGAAFSLVFVDPPYGKSLGEKALASAVGGGWLAPGALVVWEERSAQSAPPGFEPADSRRYGDTWITILRFAGA